jgi:ADP-ribose pyrophosphatase YjhB (NUDIX family)
MSIMDIRRQIAAIYEQYGDPALTDFHLEDLIGNSPREAGVFTLADAGGRVVLIRRKPHANWPGIDTYWWLPGGGCEAGEGLDEAAVREFREETGLEVRIERLLLARVQDERFFKCWFRGRVVAGSASPAGDPCHTTAEVRLFSPADIPAGALWSDLDRIVLAYEGFIHHPIDALLTRYGLEERPAGRRTRTCC